ncbi:hypothetical protein E2C01_017518 [Portunus trituberculatus]|uniref:Uncharacterized protein n=1 Tax=Portunus trituberculatus TaxID=210409 RepID=A0A5B7DSQ9_PORTR|nr:hypothetical protein [Portunus trituberculatus]
MCSSPITISSSCRPTRSGCGQEESSSCMISESSIILFSSSMTQRWQYAWPGSELKFQELVAEFAFVANASTGADDDDDR